MQLPRRSIPPISGLIAFEATARHLSFSRAAEDLALTQGAVSKRVRQLEDQLGVILISRGGHQVQLTRMGEHYLPQVRELLSQIDRSTRDLLAEAGRPRALVLQAETAFSVGWLMPRLGEFARICPDVVVHLRSMPPPGEEVPADADLTIRLAAPEAALAEEAVLMANELGAVVGRQLCAGRTDAELLHDLPLLRQEGDSERWRCWLEARGIAEPPGEGPVCDHPALMIAAAVHGRGIALLPRLMVQDELRSGRLRLVGGWMPGGESYLLSVSARSMGMPEVEQFRAWLQGALLRLPELYSVAGERSLA